MSDRRSPGSSRYHPPQIPLLQVEFSKFKQLQFMAASTELDSQGKLDILIDQVGLLTEGLTEMKMLIREQAEVTKQQGQLIKQQTEAFQQQAEAIKQQAASIHQQTEAFQQQTEAAKLHVEAAKQQAETARLQAESVSRLVALLEQKN